MIKFSNLDGFHHQINLNLNYWYFKIDFISHQILEDFEFALTFKSFQKNIKKKNLGKAHIIIC